MDTHLIEKRERERKKIQRFVSCDDTLHMHEEPRGLARLSRKMTLASRNSVYNKLTTSRSWSNSYLKIEILGYFSPFLPCWTVQSPPQVVKQPPSDELLFQVAQRIDENDKPFIIECEAEGEPAPK